jgi:5,10-methenyltetrahydrofolate synthetase
MLKKTDLRRALLATRQALDTDLRARWDAIIGTQLHAWLTSHPVQTLGIYWPIRGEPDLRAAYVDLATQGVRLALPVVTQRDAPLTYAAWSPGDDLVKDRHGVPAPAGQLVLLQPDAILVPCVGFNAQHFRLGYGAGLYDRTLAQTPRPVAVGIAYACGLIEFDAAPHDIALDTILTESFSLPSFLR